MKKILLATIALTMLATPALAQHRGDRDQGRDHRGPGGYEQQHRKPDMRKQQKPRRHWSKGQHVSAKHRGHVDYRRHNLKTPPRGYRWVENDGQYLMIGIASGLIAAIVTSGR